MSIVAFAPNWLGDAVMALPAMDAIRRHAPHDRFYVAARRSVASLFELVPGVDGVVTLGPGGGVVAASRLVRADADAVRATGAQTAILFPNSVRAAVTARLAGIPVRCGFRSDGRSVLLTRAFRAPRRIHQADVYRSLVEQMGMAAVAREPVLSTDRLPLAEVRSWFAAQGWPADRRLVGVAPGAAFGSAKRWPLDRVAAVVAGLVAHDVACVLVGAQADVPATAQVRADVLRIAGAGAERAMLDLAGQTSLPQLAAVLSACTAFVSNDSGAMHLAAALGTPLVAIFGPTNERATGPLARPDHRATVVVGNAWCRPCGFRHCPLDHRCMRRVSVESVDQAVRDLVGTRL